MMRNEIVVSVIMSVYNGETYINDAIESVLIQDMPYFELIIVDDASNDKTAEIISSYKDDRIRLIKNEQQRGLTYNLNAMLKMARGKYVARLDADDLCDRRRLRMQMQILDEKKDVEMVCSYANAIGDRKGLIKMQSNFEILKSSLLFGNPIVHSSVMFRNKKYSYDEKFLKSQDYELWDRMIAAGEKIYVIKKPLVNFRFHNRQISVNYGGQQGYFSDLVKVRALERIGIFMNIDQQKKYLALLNNNKVDSWDDYLLVKSILVQIERENAEKNLYAKKELRLVMRGIYYKLYIASKEIELTYMEKIDLLRLVSIRYWLKMTVVNIASIIARGTVK